MAGRRDAARRDRRSRTACAHRIAPHLPRPARVRTVRRVVASPCIRCIRRCSAPAKAAYRVPFVLDYQDPWVGAWGRSVGGGSGGTADWKSRASRPPHPGRSRGDVNADALVAVSQGTIDGIVERIPPRRRIVPHAVIPLGFEPADFAVSLRGGPARTVPFNPADGDVHLCYVGTLLPTGFRDAALAFRALERASRHDPAAARLPFTSSAPATSRIPSSIASCRRACGVGDAVTEVPGRLDYLDTLSVLMQASAVLLLGSSSGTTASKLYPALLSQRPIRVPRGEQRRADSAGRRLRAVGAHARPTATACPTRRWWARPPAICARSPPVRRSRPPMSRSTVLTTCRRGGLPARLGAIFDRVAA